MGLRRASSSMVKHFIQHIDWLNRHASVSEFVLPSIKRQGRECAPGLSSRILFYLLLLIFSTACAVFQVVLAM